MSQLLGPEDGVKVVALEDGVTHGRELYRLQREATCGRLPEGKSRARAHPHGGRCAGCIKARIAR